MGVIKGDTRSLDNGSYIDPQRLAVCVPQNEYGGLQGLGFRGPENHQH